MTIIVSTISPKLIVMLSDSTITVTHHQEEGDSFNEYETASKYHLFPGVGCITTWGDHTYNKLGKFLQRQNISQANHSVVELAELTHKYICEDYSKDEELGFHIGGFDRAGMPRLYHSFWGFDRPSQLNVPTDHLYDHSDWVFLYNGRNDLAHVVINAFMNEIEKERDIRFDLKTPIGRICLCDFVARFAAEITPQVGPPFIMHLIFPDNSIERIENTSFSPLSLQSINSALPKLFRQKTESFSSTPLIKPDGNNFLTGTSASAKL